METLAEKIKSFYRCNMTEEELYAELAYKIEEIYNKYFDYNIFLNFKMENIQCVLQWEKKQKETDLKDIYINFLIPDKFNIETVEDWLKNNGLEKRWKNWVVKLNK